MKIATSIVALAGVVAVVTFFATVPSRADDPHWHGGDHGGDMHHFGDRDEHVWRGGQWFHGDHGGRGGWWWIVDGNWYFYPAPVYPYPDPYVPPVVMPAPQPTPAPQYWYYCPNPAGYYPYVPACPTNWMAVPASPG